MCTRVFWSGNRVAKVVSRTMDWAVSDDPVLWAVPRGTKRMSGDTAWESRYGVVGLSMWDSGTTDAVNSAGLAAHALYLGSADFAAPGSPGAVSNLLWAQWILDHCATVDEAVRAVGEVPVVSARIRGQELGCHLALEDASGDSAIVEPIGGDLRVHHGREYQVMANDPPYAQQLENLRRYRPFGGDEPLPGGIESIDRFVRAAYFLHYLPEPPDLAGAIAGVVNIAGTVACPPGAPYDDFGVYPTWWTSVIDLTNLTYYFWSHASPSLIWADLSGIDLGPGAPVLAMNPRDTSLTGDVTGRLVPAELTY
ncbi:MAG: linear amide C-N hydrolase [Streptosporangiaceae bacterium]